jgi:tetratricopeptide (TPR) repeat protein
LAGRYDEARVAYERALAIESEANSTLVYTVIPFLYAHQFDEARRRLETARRLGTQSRLVPVYLALLAALEGRFQEAERVIPSDTREMEKFRDSQTAFYAFASIFALQGNSGEAVRWLRKTVEIGMPDYPLFARDPNLNRVRASAEFVQFMAELKPRYEAAEREFR